MDSEILRRAFKRQRAKVRRLLAKYDYPPDLEERAIELVLQLAKLFAGKGDQ